MEINGKITNMPLLDWLCKLKGDYKLEIEFTSVATKKVYTSIPQSMQNIMKENFSDSVDFPADGELNCIQDKQSTINSDGKVKAVKRPRSPRSESSSNDLIKQESTIQSKDVALKRYLKAEPGKKAVSAAVKQEKSAAVKKEVNNTPLLSAGNQGYVQYDIGGKAVNSKGMIKSLQQTVVPLVDSTALLMNNNCDELWARYKQDGYVYFRDLIDRDTVLQARANAIKSLTDMGHADSEGRARSSHGWTVDCTEGCVISGKAENASSADNDLANKRQWKRLCDDPVLVGLRTSSGVRSALSSLSRGKSAAEGVRAVPFSFEKQNSWLRVKAPGELTPAHSDIFYLRVRTGR